MISFSDNDFLEVDSPNHPLYYKLLTHKFRVAKKRSGMTYAEISEKTGIHIRTLQQYSAGTQPTAANLGKICACLGVTPNWFLSPLIPSKLDTGKLELTA